MGKKWIAEAGYQDLNGNYNFNNQAFHVIPKWFL